MQPKSSLNLEIEGLRGVSILFVLIAHAHLIAPGSALTSVVRVNAQLGTGVDLFFCISGYVISRVLIEELDRARLRGAGATWDVLKRFWIKRAFRLLPSAYVTIALTLLFTALFRDDLFGSL